MPVEAPPVEEAPAEPVIEERPIRPVIEEPPVEPVIEELPIDPLKEFPPPVPLARPPAPAARAELVEAASAIATMIVAIFITSSFSQGGEQDVKRDEVPCGKKE